MPVITITTQKAKHPGNLADELGALQAQIAELRKKEKQLKDAIIANGGDDGINGNFFRATASYVEASAPIDWQAAFFALVPKTRQEQRFRYTTSKAAYWRIVVKALPTKAAVGEAA